VAEILKFEPRGKVTHYGPEYMGGPSIDWAVLGGGGIGILDAGRLSQRDVEESKTTPLYLDRGEKGRDYWPYADKIYSTTDYDLTPEDVLALVNEAANRRRLRLEKAHALAAMTRELSSKSRRTPIPQDVKVTVWQRDNGRCVQCSSQQNLEFDHVIPVAMGGSNTVRNIQLLCEACNRRKGATLG
jgi:5-methylcytosine-specific restriction endonuclease McrA